MADRRSTKIHFIYMVYLCFLAVFCPKKFIKEEIKDNEHRKGFSAQDKKEHGVYVVNRAFWHSFGLITLFGFIGGVVGWLLRSQFNQPSSNIIIFLQVIGAGLLLWGTLFIRGWEIQTICGVTLIERVNQWLYRTLCCIGTMIVICSLIWEL
ncbi:hypothetical protein KKG56_05635 [bacterium]|nr:hypothetical protein [bacterium]